MGVRADEVRLNEEAARDFDGLPPPSLEKPEWAEE